MEQNSTYIPPNGTRSLVVNWTTNNGAASVQILPAKQENVQGAQEPDANEIFNMLVMAISTLIRAQEEQSGLAGYGAGILRQVIRSLETGYADSNLKTKTNYNFIEFQKQSTDKQLTTKPAEEVHQPPAKNSLKEARLVYNNLMQKQQLTGGDTMLKELLEEKYGKASLESKPGFTWQDINGATGYCIAPNGFMEQPLCGRDGFKYPAQALSALAFAQLTHIVAKYNSQYKNIPNPAGYFKVIVAGTKLEPWACGNNVHGICFISVEDAQSSIEVNKELWEQYWMINIGEFNNPNTTGYGKE